MPTVLEDIETAESRTKGHDLQYIADGIKELYKLMQQVEADAAYRNFESVEEIGRLPSIEIRRVAQTAMSLEVETARLQDLYDQAKRPFSDQDLNDPWIDALSEIVNRVEIEKRFVANWLYANRTFLYFANRRHTDVEQETFDATLALWRIYSLRWELVQPTPGKPLVLDLRGAEEATSFTEMWLVGAFASSLVGCR